MKPERVRGVIFAIVMLLLSCGAGCCPDNAAGRTRFSADNKTLPSRSFWDESAVRFVVPPKFKAGGASFCLLRSGEGAAGVSAPAPPLSFLRSGRAALSGAPLSVGPGSGVLLRHPRGAVWFCIAVIVCAFCRNVKRWDGWRG